MCAVYEAGRGGASIGASYVSSSCCRCRLARCASASSRASLTLFISDRKSFPCSSRRRSRCSPKRHSCLVGVAAQREFYSPISSDSAQERSLRPLRLDSFRRNDLVSVVVVVPAFAPGFAYTNHPFQAVMGHASSSFFGGPLLVRMT